MGAAEGLGGFARASVRAGVISELARESGLLGVLDRIKVAKHDRGERIYLIRFHYVRPRGKRLGLRKLKPQRRVVR